MNQENKIATKTDTVEVAWEQLERLLYQNKFDQLSLATVINALPSNLTSIKGVQATQIKKIVYDKKEDTLAKLTSVYTAMHSSDTPVFIVMNNTSNQTEFYIGVNNGDEGECVTNKMQTLEFALQGNFPGLEYAPGNVQVANKLAALINCEEYKAMSCLVGVPSLKMQEEAGFCQGLEKVIEALGKQNYIAVLLATPVQRWELDTVEAGYQELYSTLSMMNIAQLNLSQQDSVAVGEALSKGLAKTVTSSIAQTDSTTRSQSKTISRTVTDGTTDTSSNTFGVGTYGGVGFAGVGMAGVSANYSHTSSHSVSHSVSHGIAKTIGISHGIAKTVSNSIGETASVNITDSLTQSKAIGTAITYNIQDRYIVDNLKILEEQLQRIRTAKNYGAWNWGVYFLAKNPTIVKSCADVFTGVLSGEQTGLSKCDSFVLWKKNSCNDNNTTFDLAKKSLATFNHPVFQIPSGETIVPTTLLTTPEVSIGMAFPRKSLPSVPVFEVAEFGRSVTSLNLHKNHNVKTYHIGNIFHLGKKTEISVDLDVDSLCMHTFVTGSTGAGKSNAVYTLLKCLYTNNGEKGKIPFLVIEPAKGEYKDAFGFLNHVHVFGTNPEFTKLLKINPFSFPPQVHIMEHIDRLIEILNAAWPMYSAMPAILKDAVEKMYEKCGWNLQRSTNRYSHDVFPDFHDLLEVLPRVILQSGYSAEVTSNYTGALLTRVKSLTNGYFKTIFQKDELEPQTLFDESCIVDLSRVGSTETKSLLMGIVFMKLQEYRMANATKGNQPLRHITVLEEAHNLLRRTSTEQSMESANLLGKSVEMMTNAIAEMRTYGEGFIIADQAPGLLDQAVIRNTNTKIIFRLPDYQDRLLVGQSENLNETQIDELARLKTGCASVYQNDWQEAVLCQFNKYDAHDLTSRTSPEFIPDDSDKDCPDSRTRAKTLLLMRMSPIKSPSFSDRLSDEEVSLYSKYYPERLNFPEITGTDSNCRPTLNEISNEHRKELIADLLGIKEIRNELHKKHLCGDEWTREMLRRMFSTPWTEDLDSESKKNLLSVVFHLIAGYANEEDKERWLNEAQNVERWHKEIVK